MSPLTKLLGRTMHTLFKKSVLLHMILVGSITLLYSQIYIKGDAIIYKSDSAFIQADTIILIKSTDYSPVVRSKNLSQIFNNKNVVVVNLDKITHVESFNVEVQKKTKIAQKKTKLLAFSSRKKPKQIKNRSPLLMSYKNGNNPFFNLVNIEYVKAIISFANINGKKSPLQYVFQEKNLANYFSLVTEASKIEYSDGIKFCSLNFHTHRSRPPPIFSI